LPVSAMSVGFGNYVVRERVTAIVAADSAPSRRAVQEARKQGTLIDATQGRRTRSVLFLDNGQILISGLSQDTLARRVGAQGDLSE
jgi:extracellular matrix regulatory protein A